MLQPNWLVHANFNGHNDPDQFLYEEKGSGDVVLHDNTHDVRVGGLGPEWSLRGVGDYLGDHKDQILIENTNGWLVTGEIDHGVMTYKSLGGLGPEWHFVGTADYLHNGHDTYLIENDHGHYAVGDAAALTWGASYSWLI